MQISIPDYNHNIRHPIVRNISARGSSMLYHKNLENQMKRITLILFMLAIGLAACAAPVSPTSTPHANFTPIPPGDSDTVTEMLPAGKLPAPSFESQTYLNEQIGWNLLIGGGLITVANALIQIQSSPPAEVMDNEDRAR